MGTCFSLNGRDSAINQSWVCPDWQDKPSWADTEPCIFLFDQQLNRPKPNYCGAGETAVFITLFWGCLFCNLFAIVNFQQRHVKPSFLILIIALATCNILGSFIGLLGGIARNFDDWFYGQAGCALIMGGRCVLFTASIWTITLISFERRMAISNRTISARRILIAVGVLITVDISVWMIPFGYLQVAQSQNVFVDGVKNGRKSVEVCALLAYRKPHRSIIECGFSFFTFLLPIVLTTANYWYIWREVRSVSPEKQQQRECLTFCSFCHRSSRRGSLAAISAERQEIYLAKLMSSSLVLFVTFNLPVNGVIAYISYDLERGKTVQSITFVAASWIMYLQASLNPFIQSVIKMKSDRQTQTTSSSGGQDHSLFRPADARGLIKHDANARRTTDDDGDALEMAPQGQQVA